MSLDYVPSPEGGKRRNGFSCSFVAHSATTMFNSWPSHMRLIEFFKVINPVWFVKESFKFMEGYNFWYVLIMLPSAYVRFVWLTVKDYIAGRYYY